MNPTTLFPSIWHRRAASVSVMATIVALGLLGYVYFSSGESATIVLYEALGASVAGLLLSFIARMPVPDRIASWFSFVGFAFAVAGTGLSLMNDVSSNIHLIFVLILSLLSLIAGVFGPLAWLVLIAVIAPYMVSHFMNDTDGTITGSFSFILFYVLPIFASWLLWHGGPRRQSKNSTERSYSNLAEQLNQVSNEAEIVISSIADGVVAISPKGEIQLINPAGAGLLGWTQRDSLGLDYRSVIKLQDSQGNAIDEQHDPIFVTLHTNKPVERSDMNLQTNSGKTFLARVSITPVGEAGNGLIVVFRDITADKAEEREQAEFVSTASHEMRTPVATIEGYLGLALNPNTATIDDKARMFLIKAHESAQHLGRLFQDLLDVTKADDGRLRNLPSVTDLVAFTGDIVSGLRTKANEKGLTLTFAPTVESESSERKLTPVYYADVDGDHLREILNNLIENAIKYTKHGTVTVDVTGNNETCEISVKDSGIGIPREDITHLFQKFYRVDNTDTREIGGTGLGLYLCRRLVELIGGKIWVDSEYGHGSTFFVSLPRVSFEDAQARIRAMTEMSQRQAANEAAKAEKPNLSPPTAVYSTAPVPTQAPAAPTSPVAQPQVELTPIVEAPPAQPIPIITPTPAVSPTIPQPTPPVVTQVTPVAAPPVAAPINVPARPVQPDQQSVTARPPTDPRANH